MKPTTPIVVLFIILLFALLWLGILAQKADAPEILPVDIEKQTGIETEQPVVEIVDEDVGESMFGNDAGMELPIPDIEPPYDEESESTENLEVI